MAQKGGVTKDIALSDGSVIRMRASALIPKLYRIHFERDLLVDLSDLEKSVKEKDEGKKANLEISDLTIFENIAWLMARHAARADGIEDFPNNPDEWLDSIPHVLDIYEILPEISALLTANSKATSVPAKK